MNVRVTAAALNAMTPDERKAFAVGPFAREMHKLASSYAAPLWWIEPPVKSPFLECVAGMTVRNGSMFFIEIGPRLFGVTAAHVYQGFLNARPKARGIICRAGGEFIFDPEKKLVGIGRRREDGGHDVDIATFEFSHDELRQIGKQAIATSASEWPPRHAISEQGVYFAGFPGKSKLWLDARTISFGLYCANARVGSAGDHQITFPFEREHWIDTVGVGIPPEGMDLGGISGGPALIPTEKNGVWSFNVAGVISEAISHPVEVVVVLPAHFIAADGSVLDRRSAPLRHYVRAGGLDAQEDGFRNSSHMRTE